ncbi:MAG TPA: mechanosensitive ion channel [Vicinamibacterales bacterium]|nr:mechanosensitive ion channel [Vicinamibacterales bacterium]
MQQQLWQVVESLRQTALVMIPRLLVGLAVAIALVLLAKVVELLLRAILVRIRLDALLEQAGFDKALHRLGLRQSLNLVLPRMVYFLLLLLFARTTADAFGLVAISQAIASLFGYLPKVIAAVLLLLVGSAVSQVAGQMVRRAAEESGIEFAGPLGSLTPGFILFVVAIMAIGQLEFDTDMVRIVTVCVLSGFALAFGLSIGMGTRDITRSVMAGFYARKVFSPGDRLEVRGQRGVLKAITTTQTLLEQDDHVISMANSVFLDDAVRQ